jgi:hypothetical protein
MQPHIFQPQYLLACFVLVAQVLAVAEPEPIPEPEVVAGGGVAGTIPAALQMASTTVAGSLFTAGGTTGAVWKEITLTFATTALGTWALGPTPASGSIGLGNLVGTVGRVKTKRAAPTLEGF